MEKKFNAAHFKFETTPQRLKKEIMDEYNALKEKKKKTDHDKMFIQMVRAKMKGVKVKLMGEHIPTGTKKQWILDAADYDRAQYINSVIETVRLERDNLRRQVNRDRKQFDGATYDVVAGVFTKPLSILDIGKRITTNDPMKPKKPRSKTINYIGVELEFNANVPTEDTRTISEALVAAGLNKYVCVGVDGSCGWEVRVLLDDQNFIEPLTKILAVLKAKGFTTDARCGTHVHLDMRNRDVKQCYENLFKSQTFLRKFLDKSRRRNNYCKKNTATTFDESVNTGDRYQSINPQSYRKFQTLEVRMHQGTLEADKLIPWIKLLLKMVNYKQPVEKPINTLKQASSKYELEAPLFEELRTRIMGQGA